MNSLQNTYSHFISNWNLDTDFLFLNHGSFGACPKAVLEKQMHFREKLEMQPVSFMIRELDELIFYSKKILADFTGCNCEDISFIPNATHGVNTVLRSLKYKPGDEIIVTSHIYPACLNAARYAAEGSGAKIIMADIPFPPREDDDFIVPIMNSVTGKTRLVLVDHITSPTAVIFPVKKIVKLLEEKGVDTLIDGAHAPGSIDLDISDINPAYYTGNCHKWLCSPKGAAFLYVRPDRQKQIQPLSISHVYGDDKKFWERFQWTGTNDFTPAICVGESIKYMNKICPGGWKQIMQYNHQLAVKGREILAEALGIEYVCPENYLSSMAALWLPDSGEFSHYGNVIVDSLQDKLYNNYKIEVPVIVWPGSPKHLIRISSQIYNSIDQYRFLAEAVKKELNIS